MVPIVIYITSR